MKIVFITQVFITDDIFTWCITFVVCLILKFDFELSVSELAATKFKLINISILYAVKERLAGVFVFFFFVSFYVVSRFLFKRVLWGYIRDSFSKLLFTELKNLFQSWIIFSVQILLFFVVTSSFGLSISRSRKITSEFLKCTRG